MHGVERVDIVQPPLVHDAGRTTTTFFRRLENEPNGPAQPSGLCHEPIGKSKPNGRVPVVPAGVHASIMAGSEPFAPRPVVVAACFLPGERIHVETEGERGALPAEGQLPDDAGDAAHPGKQFRRRTFGTGTPQVLLDLVGARAHHGSRAGGGVRSQVDGEPEIFEPACHLGGSAELRPPGFRVGMKVPPVPDERVGEA